MIVINLESGFWSGMKKSPQAIHNAALAGKAKDKRLSGSVKLLNSKEMKSIVTFLSSVRKVLQDNTLPIPAGRLAVHSNGVKTPEEIILFLRESKITLAQHVSAFLAVYSDEKKRAEKELGDYFDASQFPAAESLAKKFYLEFSTSPFVDTVSPEFQGVMEKAMRDSIDRAFQMSVKDLFSRVYEQAQKAIASLGGKSFKQNTLDNIKQTSEIIRALNITQHAGIEEFASKLEKLGKLDAANLRENENDKSLAVSDLQKIVNDLEGMI